jgi:hypothetical protein
MAEVNVLRGVTGLEPHVRIEGVGVSGNSEFNK